MSAETRSQQAWSGPRPFVGREALLETLLEHVDSVVADGGRAVFLLGPEGAGKSACIALFQEHAFRRHRDLRAEYVDCAASGAETWKELAFLLTRPYRLKRSARRLLGEWIDVIPILGPIVTAITRTVGAVRGGRASAARRKELRTASESAVEAVRSLLEHGPRDLRLLIMDSFDRGDAEDLAGAAALIRRLGETRTAFVATVRTREGRPPDVVRDLILEGERLGRTHRVEMRGLSREELGEAVSRATRGEVPEEWLDWLLRVTGGWPGRVWEVLGELTASGRLRRAGRAWEWTGSPPEQDGGPETAELPELDPGDRRLLALAALEGTRFHSDVVAELGGLGELEVEDRLSALRRTGLIEYRGEVELAGDVASVYEFRSQGEAQALAAELEPAERRELEDRLGAIRTRLGLGEGS